MSTSLPAGLTETIAQKSDEDLYSYFASAADYTPEALEAVRDEIRKRKLPEEQLEELAAAARAESAARKNRPNDSTFTFNGFGTRLYGKCDFRADGSYLTTMWITALYWPLFPLRTLRIRPLEGRHYEVLKRFKTNWPQAGRTYGFVSLLIIGILLASLVERFSSSEDTSFLAMLAVWTLSFTWLFWSRRKARLRQMSHSPRPGS